MSSASGHSSDSHSIDIPHRSSIGPKRNSKPNTRGPATGAVAMERREKDTVSGSSSSVSRSLTARACRTMHAIGAQTDMTNGANGHTTSIAPRLAKRKMNPTGRFIVKSSSWYRSWSHIHRNHDARSSSDTVYLPSCH